MSLLVVCFALATTAVGQDFWIGEGDNNRWDNPDNWASGDVPVSGEVRINGPDAVTGRGPLIEEGIEAFAGVLIADAGEPEIVMTGGILELTGWGAWWGDAPGTLASFEMSGGEVNFVGNPGILELGWQNEGDPPDSSVGVWTMTGGVVNAQGVDMPGKNNGGAGVINLWGGTLNVGLSRGGLALYEGAKIDVTDGQLVLEGDQTALVEDYIADEFLVGYAGSGDLQIEFDGQFTTVNAVNPFPGDFVPDGELDVDDLDLLSEAAVSGQHDPRFDLTGDSLVDQADVIHWVKQLRQTWIGDADVDGQFDSSDLVSVFATGKYEQGPPAVWSEGDWNADGRFDSGDFVVAFSDGGYEQGPVAAAVASVPEPTGGLAWLLAAIAFSLRICCSQRL